MSVKIIMVLFHGTLLEEEQFTILRNKILLPDCCANINRLDIKSAYIKFKKDLIKTLPNLLVTKRGFYNIDNEVPIKKPYSLYVENDKLCDIELLFSNVLEFKKNFDQLSFIDDIKNLLDSKGEFNILKMNEKGYNLFVKLYEQLNVDNYPDIEHILENDRTYEDNRFTFKTIINKTSNIFINGLIYKLYNEMYREEFVLFSITEDKIKLNSLDYNIREIIDIGTNTNLDELIKLPDFERRMQKYKAILTELYDTIYIILFEYLNENDDLTFKLFKYIIDAPNFLTITDKDINVITYVPSETGENKIITTVISLYSNLEDHINNGEYLIGSHQEPNHIGKYYYSLIYNTVLISKFSVYDDFKYDVFNNITIYSEEGNRPVMKLSNLFEVLNNIVPDQFIIVCEACQSSSAEMCKILNCQLNAMVDKYIKEYVSHIKSAYINEANIIKEIYEILSMPKYSKLLRTTGINSNSVLIDCMVNFIINYYENTDRTYESKIILEGVYHIIYLLQVEHKYKTEDDDINLNILYIAIILICDEIRITEKIKRINKLNSEMGRTSYVSFNYDRDVTSYLDIYKYTPEVLNNNKKYIAQSIFNQEDNGESEAYDKDFEYGFKMYFRVDDGTKSVMRKIHNVEVKLSREIDYVLEHNKDIKSTYVYDGMYVKGYTPLTHKIYSFINNYNDPYEEYSTDIKYFVEDRANRLVEPELIEESERSEVDGMDKFLLINIKMYDLVEKMLAKLWSPKYKPIIKQSDMIIQHSLINYEEEVIKKYRASNRVIPPSRK